MDIKCRNMVDLDEHFHPYIPYKPHVKFRVKTMSSKWNRSQVHPKKYEKREKKMSKQKGLEKEGRKRKRKIIKQN